jgi:hypothetical protein
VPNRLLSHVQRQWIISVLLMTVVLRALIPAGFMPAADFTYQICPDGFPAQLLHDEHAAHHAHHHDGDHGSHEHGAARAEHCVFAAAAGVGPALHIALLLTSADNRATPYVYFPPAPPALESYRAQQPRGPPRLS